MAKITLVDTSCLLSFFLLLLADLSCCKEILVGGKHTAWKIPSSPSDSLNKWAESLRFHVGDSLGEFLQNLGFQTSETLCDCVFMHFVDSVEVRWGKGFGSASDKRGVH